MVYKFTGVLTANGWVMPAYVDVGEDGLIRKVSDNYSGEVDEEVNGLAIPGFRNAHSHAFQYAMAGLAEVHKPGVLDDFWSWRETMYKVALSIDPDQMESIASYLYSEMLRNGYTHVAEFHYVHLDPNGEFYNNRAELGSRLIAAANTAGIKITLIPIFYQMGNFGEPPQDHQKRFISNNYDEYIHLWEATEQAASHYDKASLGVGVHSLRAVDGDDIIRLTENYDPKYPFHIHVAEQIKEVDDCLAFYGVRPVQWLLNEIQLDDNFHLVHATHMNQEETIGVAQSGANVVLCPSTEGNLGDGIFPLQLFNKSGGSWSIGTDSHIGLNPLEELRLLDYRERLIRHQRNILSNDETGNAGELGFQKVLVAGKRAMGEPESGYLDEGCTFDAVVFDSTHPLLATRSAKFLLNSLIYSMDASYLLGTIVDGKWAIKTHHPNHEELRINFIESIRQLKIF